MVDQYPSRPLGWEYRYDRQLSQTLGNGDVGDLITVRSFVSDLSSGLPLGGFSTAAEVCQVAKHARFDSSAEQLGRMQQYP